MTGANDSASSEALKKCGTQLTETILKQDFHLNDKFCDASELEDAYNNIVSPNDVAEFLSVLIDMVNKCHNITDDDQLEETNFQSAKKKKVLSLYQNTFYMLNNGKKCTPLHILNSKVIYNTCKSKALISSLKLALQLAMMRFSNITLTWHHL